MKKSVLIGLALLLLNLISHAQRVISYQVLPANPVATDNVRLVLAVQYANCGFFAGNYSYTLASNIFDIKGCYSGAGSAIGCTRYDTVGLGRLPTGNYTLTSTSYIYASSCANATPRVGSPNTTGAFTVGTVLAARQSATKGQLFPTVLSPTAATIWLTNATQLQQVSILDVAGREQLRYETGELVAQKEGVHLSLPNGLPGLYFLRATNTAGQVTTYRFIRQ